MRPGFLLLLLITCTTAQMIRKSFKLMNVKSLADLKAKLVEAGEKLVIIGFLPKACPYSRRLIPQVEKLAYRYRDSIIFLRVHEGHDDIFDEFRVKSVPTFVYVKVSIPLSRRTGSNINDVVDVIEAAKRDEEVLNTVSKYPEEKGQLYEVECYDDFKGRLSEAKDKLVVIAFMPNHCPTSYSMIPQVQKLAKKYRRTVAFMRVKEDHDDIYEVFGVQTVPTFIFMQDKKKVAVKTGGGIIQLAATLEAVLSGEYSSSTTTTTTTANPSRQVYTVANPEDMKERLTEAGKNVLVIAVFMTHWCPNCKTLDPKLGSLADEYYPTVVFLKVYDDGRNKDIFNEFEIQRVPTFVFIKNWKKISMYEGTTIMKIKARIELQEFL